ncbi:MAG: flavin reductase family protein [Thalassobaculum sp.]|uniref:flavin reductase family protein n=1 Tax=Thalassobaculum sp. TaxID=2022740 RepID=UPI0032EE8058
MPIDPSDFRAVLGRYATGVTIVTTRGADSRPTGLTVNSFTSVSLDPPLVLFCLDRAAGSGPAFAAADCFAVNILAAGQAQKSARFADPVAARFVDDGVTTWETGAPILSDALAALDCRVHARHDGGDHVILVGRVLRAQVMRDEAPLLYWRGDYRGLS